MRTYAIWTALGLILGSGLAHGWLSRRWSSGEELARAVARLDRIPLAVGEWDGGAQELGGREQEVGRIDGYVLRRYTHRPTGAQVQVLVVCGRPGPIAAHTPDVCYRGAGFMPTQLERRQEDDAQLWTALFRRETATRTEQLRIFWTFTAAGAFLTPDSPRLAFASQPALYKVYVIWDLSPGDGDAAAEEVRLEFLRSFLKESRAALFPS